MSWLSNTDLETALANWRDDRVRQAFLGIYPNDYLPRTRIQPPVFVIVNTDVHNLPGQHWKVIFIDENHQGEVFDSLATPLSNHVIRFMNQHTTQWKTNHRMFQHPTSSQCGAYVLYFITQRFKYESLRELCLTFSTNLKQNERMIRRFYHQLQ